MKKIKKDEGLLFAVLMVCTALTAFSLYKIEYVVDFIKQLISV
jgi:hypothetical protein